MATYHLSVKIVRRSKRQNVVAKATYNARGCIISELNGKKYDYRYKGKADSFIEIPNNAPKWLRDLVKNPTKFWETIELIEKRKDAQLAREIELSLPHQLSDEDRRQVALSFARELVNRGMVADVAIHPPDPKGDKRNYHAHILLTLRNIGDNSFEKKNRSWNSKILLRAWRRRWAEMVNLLLLERGIDAHVDHRSFKSRGLNLEPTIYLGPKINGLERRGVNTIRGDGLRNIKKRNQSRLQYTVKAEEKEPLPRKSRTDDLMNAHKKRCALQRIQRDIRGGRPVNDLDIKVLSENDQEDLKDRDFNYLREIIQQQDLGKEMEGNER